MSGILAGFSRCRMLALVALARRHDVPERRLLAGSGCTLADLSDPRRSPGPDREFQAVRNLIAATGALVPLAIEVGLGFHLSTAAAWGEAMRTSRTLGHALALSQRFAPDTRSQVQVTVAAGGDAVRVGYRADRVPADLRVFFLVWVMVAEAMAARELLGFPLPVDAVTVAAAPPPDAASLAGFYRVPVGWSAARTEVAVARHWFAVPLGSADETAHRAAVAELRRSLGHPDRPHRTTARVRAYLAAQHDRDVRLSEVAAELRMSERSLRRHLVAAGVSYRDLLAGARCEAAEELLRAGLPLAEVAARMGYADYSAFSHAFKRWSGMTPRAWRQRRPSGRS